MRCYTGTGQGFVEAQPIRSVLGCVWLVPRQAKEGRNGRRGLPVNAATGPGDESPDVPFVLEVAERARTSTNYQGLGLARSRSRCARRGENVSK